MKRLGSVILIVLLLVVSVGEHVPVHAIATKQASSQAKVTITKKKTTITAGKSYTFRAKTEGTTETITWSVSNKKIGTITKAGKFSAKRAGKVTITAKAGTASAKVKVTVKGKQIIAIDPGHQSKGNNEKEAIGPGAKTTKAKVASGTSGVSSKVPEYKLTLEVSLKLKEELLDRGYEVVLTRDTNDVNISNKERALFANESGADICIRIHADGSTNASVTGASALYPSTKNPYVSKLSKASKKLANSVIKSYCKKTGAKNRGIVARDDLTGTNWSTIPVIVLEMGFMSNAKEDKRMQTDSYQKKIVEGICNGIDSYYK
ncbi:N-acetylmuramoyl-L-alanine amidase [Anaerosporobacter faecicola]|uniref:N-acetylmuramoyl-L-alanine amidase n=1 Tax=Anaerosporobacter faecicola TaxID=2718714 RepID=UPI00143B60BA|nr:N-acetylmuramoyl-L-alanine amidase [Anaerosporobacter faecicola]